MPPKRVPTVSTGNPASATSTVPAINATMLPGKRRRARLDPTTTAREPMASSVAGQEMVGKPWTIWIRRGRNTPEGCAIESPKKSLICVLAIRSAMPFVKPTSTGRGM
jgi:hypothetical protein